MVEKYDIEMFFSNELGCYVFFGPSMVGATESVLGFTLRLFVLRFEWCPGRGRVSDC